MIAAQTPIGLMGGPDGENVADGSSNRDGARDGTGTERTETLYIEVRQNNIPQDPATWFRTDKDGL